MKSKKLLFCLMTACMLLLSFSACFATSGDQGQFVDSLAEGINADSMWGAVAPNAKLIIYVFIFAFAYGLLRRVLKKGSKGKFGM